MASRGDFTERRSAGRALATALAAYSRSGSATVVVGLTHGGMAVAAQVAAALQLPLDVLVVHRIAAPAHPALAVAAVAEPGHVVVNRPAVRRAGLSDTWVAEAVAQGTSAVNRRARAYRGRRERRDLRGQRVIVVDDSVATGMTMQAAVTALRTLGAREVIVAVPVLPAPAAERLRPQVDRLVSLATPAELVACDLHYPSPHAVSDDDIRHFLQRAEASPPRSEKDGVGAGGTTIR